MRIVHVAPTALSEISAAWRIKRAQRSIGLDAIASVQIGETSDHIFTFDKREKIALKKKKFFERIDSIPVRLSPQRKVDLPWSSGWTGRKVSGFINHLKPDIVNFHWLTNGSVNLSDLKHIQCPVVFTLHDVWANTGGCHCNLECDHWQQGCHDCPQLGKSVFGFEFAHMLRQRKVSAYENIRMLSIVSPSRWLAKLSSQSSCFINRDISVIPNCLNTDLFRPGDSVTAKMKLNLPADKLLLGFGAVNSTSVTYKGFDLLIDAMQLLQQRGYKNIHLVIFGAEKSNTSLPFSSTFLGTVHSDTELSQIYQACDIFVSPSRQDNFPSTVVEATASGTPVVAFDVGGVSDLVEHKVSGYLAKPFDVSDLANGIQWLSESNEKLISAGKSAAHFTARYCAPETVALKYLYLYEKLISAWRL